MMQDNTRICDSRERRFDRIAGGAVREKFSGPDLRRISRSQFHWQARGFVVRFFAIFVAAIFGASGLAFAQQTAQSSGAAFAISDGHGQISLMWFPPTGQWPLGGWKIEDSAGGIVAAHVSMGDADALKGLSADDAATVQKLPQTLASPAASGSQGKLIYGILALNAFGSPAYARALGLSWMLSGVAPGARTYRISGLSATGQPTGLVLSTAPVDGSAATPLPPTPADLRAEASRNGVALSWTAIPENRALPVISYDVLRDSSEQSGVEVNARPVITGVKWDPKTPVLLDREAPVEEMLTYHISSLDIFGRRSAPADIKILFPDFAALEPPEPVVAASAANKVEVTWKAGTNPHTAGYLVERGYLYDGPFEALTPQALLPGTKNFEDAQVRGGTAYYYRVRAVGPRGDMGTPSHAAMAQPSNAGAPPKPLNLKAELGNTRVRLTWDPVPFPVAGYFIERLGVGSAASSGAASSAKPSGAPGNAGWVQMNARVTPEPLYDDYFGMTSGATFTYRIVAVSYDNEESAPSDAVSVTLPDTSLPAIPVITRADGSDGKATLAFAPGLPAEKTAEFLILRGGSEKDLGVVIGDPLPATARQFEDLYVQPGQEFWYRLVAVDKNGNRSDPTPPVVIRIGSPAIPAAPAPKVTYVSDPYPQARIDFAQPPAGLAVMVEVQAGENATWVALAGPIVSQTVATDPAPPAKGRVFYRIYYRATNGAAGAPSPAAELTRP